MNQRLCAADLEATIDYIKGTIAVRIASYKGNINDREKYKLKEKRTHAKWNGKGGCHFGHPLRAQNAAILGSHEGLPKDPYAPFAKHCLIEASNKYNNLHLEASTIKG